MSSPFIATLTHYNGKERTNHGYGPNAAFPNPYGTANANGPLLFGGSAAVSDNPAIQALPLGTIFLYKGQMWMIHDTGNKVGGRIDLHDPSGKLLNQTIHNAEIQILGHGISDWKKLTGGIASPSASNSAQSGYISPELAAWYQSTLSPQPSVGGNMNFGGYSGAGVANPFGVNTSGDFGAKPLPSVPLTPWDYSPNVQPGSPSGPPDFKGIPQPLYNPPIKTDITGGYGFGPDQYRVPSDTGNNYNPTTPPTDFSNAWQPSNFSAVPAGSYSGSRNYNPTSSSYNFSNYGQPSNFSAVPSGSYPSPGNYNPTAPPADFSNAWQSSNFSAVPSGSFNQPSVGGNMLFSNSSAGAPTSQSVGLNGPDFTFDPNMYSAGVPNNSPIGNFGGLNNPGAFDITGGNPISNNAPPGYNYSGGNVYDSWWRWLGPDTGASSSSSSSNSTPPSDTPPGMGSNSTPPSDTPPGLGTADSIKNTTTPLLGATGRFGGSSGALGQNNRNPFGGSSPGTWQFAGNVAPQAGVGPGNVAWGSGYGQGPDWGAQPGVSYGPTGNQSSMSSGSAATGGTGGTGGESFTGNIFRAAMYGSEAGLPGAMQQLTPEQNAAILNMPGGPGVSGGYVPPFKGATTAGGRVRGVAPTGGGGGSAYQQYLRTIKPFYWLNSTPSTGAPTSGATAGAGNYLRSGGSTSYKGH